MTCSPHHCTILSELRSLANAPLFKWKCSTGCRKVWIGMPPISLSESFCHILFHEWFLLRALYRTALPSMLSIVLRLTAGVQESYDSNNERLLSLCAAIQQISRTMACAEPTVGPDGQSLLSQSKIFHPQLFQFDWNRTYCVYVNSNCSFH